MAKDIRIDMPEALDGEPLQNPGKLRNFLSMAKKFFYKILLKRNSAAAPLPVNQSNPVSNPDPSTNAPNNKPKSSARPKKVTKTIWLHPIILMIQEQELGKSVFNAGVTITIALVINGGKPHQVLMHFVLTGLSVGCIGIFNGIALRQAFPKTANVVEQVGIIMVLMSFNGAVASALPVEFAWVPLLCGGLCVIPVLMAAFPHDAAADDGGGDEYCLENIRIEK